jgi:(1->4)-alpha-D-glucan 1-alpha-D-glucosylmutase
LVDPDNRRPVDYQLRRRLLQGLKRQLSEAEQDPVPVLKELLANPTDGRLKLFLIFTVLNFRRGNVALFNQGTNVPLSISGEKMKHVCAFARTFDTETIVVAVPRLSVELTEGKEVWPLGSEIWEKTAVAIPSDTKVGGELRNLFTGEMVSTKTVHQTHFIFVAKILRSFPVAILVR